MAESRWWAAAIPAIYALFIGYVVMSWMRHKRDWRERDRRIATESQRLDVISKLVSRPASLGATAREQSELDEAFAATPADRLPASRAFFAAVGYADPGEIEVLRQAVTAELSAERERLELASWGIDE